MNDSLAKERRKQRRLNPTADPMLDRIGHFLLGLADLLKLIIERLYIFAHMLIERAALPEKDGAA